MTNFEQRLGIFNSPEDFLTGEYDPSDLANQVEYWNRRMVAINGLRVLGAISLAANLVACQPSPTISPSEATTMPPPTLETPPPTATEKPTEIPYERPTLEVSITPTSPPPVTEVELEKDLVGKYFDGSTFYFTVEGDCDNNYRNLDLGDDNLFKFKLGDKFVEIEPDDLGGFITIWDIINEEKVLRIKLNLIEGQAYELQLGIEDSESVSAFHLRVCDSQLQYKEGPVPTFEESQGL
jgi:hypothetical protein